MLDDIYNTRILELAGNIPRLGRLAEPGATSRRHSRLCGSTVTVDLAMRDGAVSDYAHDVKACALGQAAAAIVARHVLGTTAEELRAVRDRMLAMLKEDGEPPDGAWAEAGVLRPVREFRARHASTMLAFEAAAEAATMIERGQS